MNTSTKQNKRAEKLKSDAVAFIKKGELKKAVATYQRALKLSPTDASMWFQMAYCLHKLGSVDEAIESCQSAIQHDPNHAKAHYMLAAIHYQNQAYQEALTEAEKAQELGFTQTESLIERIMQKTGVSSAKVLLDVKRPNYPIVDILDKVGGIPEDAQNPKYASVNEQLRRALMEMPMDAILRVLEHENALRPNGRVLKLLGFVHFQTGNLTSALEAFEQALLQTRENPVAIYECIGYIYTLQENWDSAKKWYDKSDRFNYSGLVQAFGKDYVYVLAAGLQAQGTPVFGLRNQSEFVKQYQQLQTMAGMMHFGQYTQAQIRQAATELRLHRTSKVISELSPNPVLAYVQPYPPQEQRDISSTSTNSQAIHVQQVDTQALLTERENHYQQAVALRRQNDYYGAIKELRKVIEISPDYADGYFALGTYLMVTRQFDEAIENMESALRLRPDDANIRQNLSLCYSELRQYDKAYTILAPAFLANMSDETLASSMVSLFVSMGADAAQQSLFDQAEMYFMQAIAIDPLCAQAYFNLGIAYTQQKKDGDAVQALQTAVQLGLPEAAMILYRFYPHYLEDEPYECDPDFPDCQSGCPYANSDFCPYH